MEINDLVPVREALVAWSSLGREHMVLNLRSGDCTPLEWFPAEVWKLCDGSRTVEEIVHVLEGVSSLGQGEVRQKILDILGTFRQNELIAFAPSAVARPQGGDGQERQDSPWRKS